VLAVREAAGQRAKIHIECKNWRGNVGVPILAGLLGAVSDSKAMNGICVTTSDLTKTAKEFVQKNPRLDFIPGVKLVRMMNENFGPTWFYKIERLVADSQRATKSR
jgi:restriction endonuclease Mrr